MDEIKKVKRTIDKAFSGAPHETLLVIDATTGQERAPVRRPCSRKRSN